MKKVYTDPQINYVFMDKDVITTSALYEAEWKDGLDITKDAQP